LCSSEDDPEVLYKVVCPNRMIGMGERNDDLPIEELRAVAECWGPDAVHPAIDDGNPAGQDTGAPGNLLLQQWNVKYVWHKMT
jgi:hypothetical protein